MCIIFLKNEIHQIEPLEDTRDIPMIFIVENLLYDDQNSVLL